jgi:peptidoglycan/LPS O-acetylase OafA/YrhL
VDEWRRSAPVYVDTFDGFRAYAILTIAVLHVAFFAQYVPSATVPKALLASTFLALDVLFFVSGFVLFLPVVIAGGMGDLRSYAIRRFARLAPAFYVSLVVLAIAAPLLEPDRHPPFPPVDAGTVLSHVFFVQMEASIPYSTFVPGFGLNGPVWTLAIDVIFYALLPLVAGFWLRRPFLGFVLAAAVAAGWTLALDPGDGYFKHALAPSDRYLIWHQAPLFLADCAAGMTAAWCFVKLRGSPRVTPPGGRRATTAVALASGALLVALWYVVGHSLTDSRDPLVLAGARFHEAAWLRVLVPAVLGVFAVSVSLGPGWLRLPLANPLARRLADVSYSIYLYHVMVLHFCVFTLGLDRGGTRGDVLTLGVVALAITLAIAWVSYLLVERPGRRFGRRLARRYAHASAGERAAPEPTAVVR